MLAIVGLLGPVSPAVAGPPTGVVGSTSGGDPYFPAAGNGGYEVKHYDLDLGTRPQTRALTARAQILAVAGRRACGASASTCAT